MNVDWLLISDWQLIAGHLMRLLWDYQKSVKLNHYRTLTAAVDANYIEQLYKANRNLAYGSHHSQKSNNEH